MDRKSKWLLLGAVLAAPLWGQEGRLRLKDLLEEALRNNPEIQAAQKRYEAMRQRPDQAGSLPETMLSLGYTSNGSPRPFANLGIEPTSNAGFMVTQEFPFPGKRKLRGDMAMREAEAEFQKYQQAQLTVVSRVKEAYHRLHHAWEVIDLLESQRDLFRRMLSITEARYAVGRAEQQDVLKAQTQISILEARIEKQRLDLRTRESDLHAVLNRLRVEPLPRPVDIAAGEFRLNLDELIRQARASAPMLLEEEKMIQRGETALNLARKDVYPDYALSAGYFNMGRMPDMYQFRVDFKLPTSFFRKQRAMVAEESNQLQAARRSYAGAQQRLLAEIREAYLMGQSSAKLMELYGKTIGPQANLTLESSLAAYEAGKVDFLTVLMNLISVVETEENYHMEMLQFHLSLVTLEELTGLRLIDEEVL
ncbi:MAG: TolC family protein [Acidimicrobiia bacterium]|nr:TolC family protein [Acidimicrobiia bacterium]